MSMIFRTIIIPVEYVELARMLAVTLAPEGGANLFMVPCYPIPDVPPNETQQQRRFRRMRESVETKVPSHYMSSGPIDEQFGAILQNPEQLYAMTGVGSLQDVQALAAAADMSEDYLFVALARLQLTL